MKTFTIQKVDTNLYIKGFSGQLVFLALYAVLGILLLFVVLYITTGTFVAVAVCVPGFFGLMYRLSRIQKKYGHTGWQKKSVSRKLPGFITIKKRICQA
jgi:hypothetical protein